jgi:hypothetical protein
VLLAGAGMLGGVAATSLCAGLSTDCSARWSLMGSLSAAAAAAAGRPWKLLCVMEMGGKRSSRDCAEGAGLQAPVLVPVLGPSRGVAFA